MLNVDEKKTLIQKFGRNAADTGSPEVQIALLTERIKHLEEHFKVHQKDRNSRRGLLMMISKRRRLLNYLKSENFNQYEALISKLGLRK